MGTVAARKTGPHLILAASMHSSSEKRELQAKLKVKVEMPKDVIALQRQLMAAKTGLRNLQMEKQLFRQRLDKARNANPVTITTAQFALLQKAFHPDPEHDTATPERKQQLHKAAQVFNAIKFNVPGAEGETEAVEIEGCEK